MVIHCFFSDGKQLRVYFKSLRDRYQRLTKGKSGQATPELTEREKFIIDHFTFLEPYKGKSRSRKSSRVSFHTHMKVIC